MTQFPCTILVSPSSLFKFLWWSRLRLRIWNCYVDGEFWRRNLTTDERWWTELRFKHTVWISNKSSKVMKKSQWSFGGRLKIFEFFSISTQLVIVGEDLMILILQDMDVWVPLKIINIRQILMVGSILIIVGTWASFSLNFLLYYGLDIHSGWNLPALMWVQPYFVLMVRVRNFCSSSEFFGNSDFELIWAWILFQTPVLVTP